MSNFENFLDNVNKGFLAPWPGHVAVAIATLFTAVLGLWLLRDKNQRVAGVMTLVACGLSVPLIYITFHLQRLTDSFSATTSNESELIREFAATALIGGVLALVTVGILLLAIFPMKNRFARRGLLASLMFVVVSFLYLSYTVDAGNYSAYLTCVMWGVAIIATGLWIVAPMSGKFPSKTDKLSKGKSQYDVDTRVPTRDLP